MNYTKPDGVDRVLATIGGELNRTLCILISKSGGTKETRNRMLIAKAAYEKAGLDFGSDAVATTMMGSDLDEFAIQNRWLARFPVLDLVRGRTSELFTVGVLPEALYDSNITDFLSVTCKDDKQSKAANVKNNRAMQLPPARFASGNGNGTKNLFVIPYNGKLELFSMCLHQLVIESLGKELDFNQNIVSQGIIVLGNKGSTDQNSYIQQLRDGLNDFFFTIVEVLTAGHNSALMVENEVTAGDFLNGFYLGSRQALAEKERGSLTITVTDVSTRTAGMLIAFFERAVGYNPSLVNFNAYHQPGVEAGKRAAGQVIKVQGKILTYISTKLEELFTVSQHSQQIVIKYDIYMILIVIQHLAATACRGISKTPGWPLLDSKYGLS
jgi:glucose-6-phosphate isomerase